LSAAADIGRADGNVTAQTTHQLYERYGRQIYAYCLHHLRSREEAEDAVQTTFLNAFRGLQGGTVAHSEQAWLFKIAQNVCFARHSSSARRLRLETPNNFEILQEIVPSPQREGAVELIGIEEALEAMPENQRRAILLREWQGLSYREIGQELGLSQASVEMLIFRARRALASALEQPEATTAKRKLGRGISLGSLLAGVKSLLTGGAAIKAVALAVAAGTIVVANEAEHTIVRRHLERAAPAFAPPLRHAAAASAPSRAAVAPAALQPTSQPSRAAAPAGHAGLRTRPLAARGTGVRASLDGPMRRSAPEAAPAAPATQAVAAAPVESAPAPSAPPPAPAAPAPAPAPAQPAPSGGDGKVKGNDDARKSAAAPAAPAPAAAPTLVVAAAAAPPPPPPAPTGDGGQDNGNGRGHGHDGEHGNGNGHGAPAPAPVVPQPAVTPAPVAPTVTVLAATTSAPATTTTTTTTATPAPQAPAAAPVQPAVVAPPSDSGRGDHGNGNGNGHGKGKDH
jgi:RNA polymerase sigma factor (sigma-70 family)